MSMPFLGEVRLMSFQFAPKGWALCNGQLLPINQNQPLFSLLGTAFGGDGRVNFALPDLRGRVPIHRGGANSIGARAGEETHTVTQGEMAMHGHFLNASNGGPAATNPQSPGPTRRLSNSAPGNLWGPPTNVQPMLPQTIGTTGGGQAHENRQPYLVVSLCIALVGIFPSPN